jgi:hypothetical protein
VDDGGNLAVLGGPAPAPAAPAQHQLWTLTRFAGIVAASVHPHALGLELRVEFDGKLLWSTAYTPGQSRELCVVAAYYRQAFEARGYTPKSPTKD